MESATPGQFSCICAPFFTGHLCQLPYDPCDAHHDPCQHNSICDTESDGTVTCHCLPGFEGTYCEIDTNECGSSPCQNQGYCLDGVNGYRCDCKAGFTGSHCEEDVNECASNPCQNRGICQDLVNSPCLNDASCIDLVNKYACFCRDGFQGKHCEDDVDICLEAPQNLSLCFNGGTCHDGPGANFTCSCPAGFFGEHCELELNECCSEPCLNGAVCQDLINGYRCHCRPGWTGLHCENDINECLPQPCSQGLCIQNDPGHGYTCFCRPGFVGKNCEHNYDDCLLQPCPEAHYCFDEINNVRCVPMATSVHPAPGITPTPLGPTLVPQSTLLPSQPTDFSYVFYSGDSYMEFEGIDLGAISNISVRFQSRSPEGNILYADQGPTSADYFFIKLFINGGMLQYEFGCNQEEGNRRINTTIQVDDGQEYMVFIRREENAVCRLAPSVETSQCFQPPTNQARLPCGSAPPPPSPGRVKGISEAAHICGRSSLQLQMVSPSSALRQHLTPCEAEVTVSGYEGVLSTFSNYWSGLTIQKTGHLFIGGLPHSYLPHQGAQPFYNYTGCIEIIEINKLRGFYTSNAIGGSNVENCRHLGYTETPTASVTSQWEHNTPTWAVDGLITPTLGPPPVEACLDAPCRNGGTCWPRRLPSGASSFSCDCPLHFTGPLCEQDTTVFFPSFNGMSYLELPSLNSLLEYDRNSGTPLPPGVGDVVTLYLTVKSSASQGSILYVQEENFGDRFLHVFLRNGTPTVKLGCGGALVLTVEAGQNATWEVLTPLMIRYCLPMGRYGGYCGVEFVVGDGTANRQQQKVLYPMAQVTFGPLFLGGVPPHSKHHKKAGQVTGLVGCIRELQVNNRELFIVEEAVRGSNIENCYTNICQHHPCHNGGTCVRLSLSSYVLPLYSDAENWFCRCPSVYFGKLCQFSACERSPCSHGSTCVPKTQQEAVCLCPYGRAGILCEEAINITRPSFNGTDEFGFTSFMAYSTLPGISFFYEFHMKLTFSNNGSALRDNLILFSGQKGQGINGDDFLVLGIRKGRIVHKFNLGSGVGTIVSDRLNQEIGIHTVRFGRALRSGWLKVDNQRNKTGYSPGQLVGLNVFSQFYVGGYSEYTPELLPKGARFQNGFQGNHIEDTHENQSETSYQSNLGAVYLTCTFGPEEGVSSEVQGGLRTTLTLGAVWDSVGLCPVRSSSAKMEEPVWTQDQLSTAGVYWDGRERSARRQSLCVMLSTAPLLYVPMVLPASHFPRDTPANVLWAPRGSIANKVSLTISDPSFNGNHSSWMSFDVVEGLRHRTDLQLQFLTVSPEGIMFYAAQRLSARAGDFFCLSLTSGFVQLRYNLGDGVVVLQSSSQVDVSGGTWHTVRAGRDGNQGYLWLDGEEVQGNSLGAMTALDVAKVVFLGGVSILNAVSSCAVEDEPVGFSGSIREAVLNGHQLELTEGGASAGANIGDWDGTACGYKVCQHGAPCSPLGTDRFTCACLPLWTGPICNQSIFCADSPCQHGSLCVPDIATASYTCVCPLGWQGKHCDIEASWTTARFVGNSYLRYRDTKYHTRDLMHTKISFNFSASIGEGLMLWIGEAEAEEDDYLAVGLHDGHLKVAVNLGERISLPITHRAVSMCCQSWHYISITQNRTIIQVSVDGEKIIYEDVDPFERCACDYSSLGSGSGSCSGCEMNSGFDSDFFLGADASCGHGLFHNLGLDPAWGRNLEDSLNREPSYGSTCAGGGKLVRGVGPGGGKPAAGVNYHYQEYNQEKPAVQPGAIGSKALVGAGSLACTISRSRLF
ncbi:hypothetical protein JZ751_010895, partial [Albula glossodonta]